MNPILLLLAFASAIILCACATAPKDERTDNYAEPIHERMAEATPTPRPSSTPGPFNEAVDPAGKPIKPGPQ